MKLIATLAVLVAFKAEPASAQLAGDPTAGKARFLENCVNCHGKSGRGISEFPAIAGRDAEYIAHRLTQYRGKEQVGPDAAVMWSLAGELSDATIADIAAYVSATFK